MPSPTTSSPDASPPDGLVLREYRPEESGEALALERSAAQGTSYRLAFERETFHARAAQFAESRILTARLGGRLVGVGAAAVKDAVFDGAPLRAAFLFDFRTHPQARGRRVAGRIFDELLAWARPRSEASYTFTMAEDAAAARAGRRSGTDAGGYAYLVLPTAFARTAPPLARVSAAEVREGFLRAGPAGFCTGPPADGARGHVASWILRTAEGDAGVTAFTTEGVLQERVLSLPAPLRVVRAFLRACPRRLGGGARLPEDGETLRSWYLVDLFAPSAAAARSLLRAVAADARGASIGWMHVVHTPGDPLLALARRDVPRLLAPVVPYRLLLRREGRATAPVRRLCVDPRDV